MLEGLLDLLPLHRETQYVDEEGRQSEVVLSLSDFLYKGNTLSEEDGVKHKDRHVEEVAEGSNDHGVVQKVDH